ncbi:MAG: NAD(P)H-dependent oxidoreductase [Eubacterium sp.]|nr:NAD(P)H-dependent oxidoreductase [Eubacterium sp.]
MNICVLSGSPTGENSKTLQTVLYMQKQFPDHEWNILQVGKRIRAYEKDMSEAFAALEAADMILFCYPVYTFLAPGQLHLFLEKVKEAAAAGELDLSGKYAVQVTTSKHFYDVTAMDFIRGNCRDLGMHDLGAFSADMDDLLKEKGRNEAKQFFAYVLWRVKYQVYEGTKAEPVKTSGKPMAGSVAIVTDLREDPLHPGEAEKLSGMIQRFKEQSPLPCDIIDLSEFPFSGGCLGCFNCAGTGECIYKDGFDVLLRERIQTASAIVYAFTIRDHSMGSLFKTYDDRQFCNGHRTVTMGSPIGFIVNGDLEKEPKLRMYLEARSDVGGNFLAGIAADESGVRNLALTVSYAVHTRINLPHTFYGVGGLKIFRDLIFQMQGLMKEDHRFYRDNGFYDDFPQKKAGTILAMYLVGTLSANPKIASKMKGKMTEYMIGPYRKAIEK